MRQQQPVITLTHIQQQTQFGDIAQPAIAGPVGRLQQQVLIVFGAVAATGLLVLVNPVEQAFGIGCVDLQAQQQAAQALHSLRIGLAIAQQAVQIEAPGQVINAQQQLTLLQGKGWLGARPGLAEVVGAARRIRRGLLVAPQNGLRQRLATQGKVPGLARQQLVSAAANAQLLTQHQPGSDQTGQRHHQQHGNQRNTALALHGASSGLPSGLCAGLSGKRRTRSSSP